MKYEFNQEGWSFLAQSYIQVLRFPTKKLHFYYDKYAVPQLIQKFQVLLSPLPSVSNLCQHISMLVS